VNEQEKGLTRSSKIIDGYGDDNSLDRLQEWNNYLQANPNSKVDDEFITNVWRVLDSAGNLLIRKHHDYGPKNVAHSPGHSMDSECECGTRLLESITSLIVKSIPQTNHSEIPS
jgi:hypothetical protein